MINDGLGVGLLLWLGGGLVTCLVVGRFQNGFSTILQALFMVAIGPLQKIEETASRVFGRFHSWVVGEFRIEQGNTLYLIIGSVLYSAFAATFIAGDWALLTQTLQGMGLEVSESWQPPLETGTLSAMVVIGAALFWGLVLTDVTGLTGNASLAPYRSNLRPGHLMLWLLGGLAVFCLLLAFTIGNSAGVIRAEALVEDKALVQELSGSTNDSGSYLTSIDAAANPQPAVAFVESQGSTLKADYIHSLIIQCGISSLSIISSAAACMGVAALIKFWVLTITYGLALVLMPIRFIAWSVRILLDLLYQFIESILNLLGQIGRSLLGLFGWKPTSGPDDDDAGGGGGGSDGGDSTSKEIQSRSNIENPMDSSGSSTGDQQDPEDSQSCPDEGFNPYRRQ